MLLINIIVVIFALLLIGDFLSTFVYHVPEHVFGKFHILVHHSNNKSFIHYAVLTRNPLVLLDGFLGALPYIIFVPWFWQISPIGTILGLMCGEFHVIWRHICALDWKTPPQVEKLCSIFCIVTPEIHWLHHQNAMAAYGDIFTFYDTPAQAWLRILMKLKKKIRNSSFPWKKESQKNLL